MRRGFCSKDALIYQPAWKDKASWRFVYLKTCFRGLPHEIYEKIDAYLIEKVVRCMFCCKIRDMSKSSELCACLIEIKNKKNGGVSI